MLNNSVEGSTRRIRSVAMICIVLAGSILFRASVVQILGDARLEQMAKRQFQSRMLIRPARGSILDRNGEPLAINLEGRSLAVNATKVENPRSLSRLLAKALDLPALKLLPKLKANKEFLWIKRHLSEQDFQQLKKWHLVDRDGAATSGLLLVKESKRVYPHGELAGHILGDVNVDSDGVEGIELWKNERMRGKVLSVSAIKDALGRPTFLDSASLKNVQEAKDGEPVTLTLDASLQFSVEQELRAAVNKHNAKGGSVIVMNAMTGEILAMANQPAFNPNDKSVAPDRRRNRVFTDGYEPGSTLKPLLVATALSHGWKLTDQIWGEMGKGLKIQGRKISEAESHEKFGWLNLNRLIQVSSNVGAAKLALKVGADSYFGTLKALDFGTKSGSGFPGEISGMLPARKSWQPLTLANIGFGQGILVTPIQMVRAYATFLNGGWLVQPKMIQDEVGAPVEQPKRVFTEKVAAQMIENLEGPLKEGGTAPKANLPGYRVVGKTGTAQKVDSHTHAYSKSKYVASFIGMPIHVEPKIVIFASVDEPRGAYYASETAAPLFREVLNAVANRFSMPTRGDFKIAQTPGSDRVSTSSAHPVDIKQIPAFSPGAPLSPLMPSLKGLTAREVLRVLEGRKIHLELRGVGRVLTQNPLENSSLSDGETVRVQLTEE